VKAALIATGDEVVSGQIVNTNASHLASRLSEVGVEVECHFAVLDRKDSLKDILDHLKFKANVDVVLTIGGLGPTRDDLTREVIASYSEKELIIDDAVWENMKCGLITRQIQPRKGHKWQAFFPKNATIFKNSKGTAQAFMTEAEAFKIIALPGPPSELESVLDEGGLVDWFRKKALSTAKLFSWQCINVPESELAHIVEEALIGCPFQVGYRATPPITEVKLWVDESLSDHRKWIEKIDEVCKESLYSKNNFSYINEILNEIDDLYFIDKVTSGYALQEIKRSVTKSNFKKLHYAYGLKFNSSADAMVFSKTEDDDYFLEYKNQKLVYSLKGKKLFRSRKAGIYAMLMLFKKYMKSHQ